MLNWSIALSQHGWTIETEPGRGDGAIVDRAKDSKGW